MLCLNQRNQVLIKHKIGTGGVSGVIVDPKIIFSIALSHLAPSIILVHNHPSGSIKPSAHDIKLTKKIKEGGQILEIRLLDHLIIGENDYFSFVDAGML